LFVVVVVEKMRNIVDTPISNYVSDEER